MKKLALILLLAGTSSAYALPGQQRPQQKLRPGDRPINAPARRAMVEDSLIGFYTNQFQQQAEVSNEVFVKVLPFLRQFVHDRFEISQRRTRALNQLRQAVVRGGSEEDLKRLVRDLDGADADFQANQERFLGNVDPLLNARQQARLRLLQIMADNRIRELIDAVQNPAGPRQNAVPKATQP